MNSKPVQNKWWVVMAVAAVLLIAGIVILVLTSQMKSVAKATEATSYMVGNLHLTERQDRYSHTTESRRKIEKDDDKSSKSSGGGSSTGGKF